jgi:hypothetical protein
VTPAPERPDHETFCGLCGEEVFHAAPATDAGRLDVERLENAFLAGHDYGGDYPVIESVKYAAEYAALSRQAEKETA